MTGSKYRLHSKYIYDEERCGCDLLSLGGVVGGVINEEKIHNYNERLQTKTVYSNPSI